jgi:hypothetical protein
MRVGGRHGERLTSAASHLCHRHSGAGWNPAVFAARADAKRDYGLRRNDGRTGRGTAYEFPSPVRRTGEGARRADEGFFQRVPMPKEALIRPAGHLLPSRSATGEGDIDLAPDTPSSYAIALAGRGEMRGSGMSELAIPLTYPNFVGAPSSPALRDRTKVLVVLHLLAHAAGGCGQRSN